MQSPVYDNKLGNTFQGGWIELQFCNFNGKVIFFNLLPFSSPAVHANEWFWGFCLIYLCFHCFNGCAWFTNARSEWGGFPKRVAIWFSKKIKGRDEFDILIMSIWIIGGLTAYTCLLTYLILSIKNEFMVRRIVHNPSVGLIMAYFIMAEMKKKSCYWAKELRLKLKDSG